MDGLFDCLPDPVCVVDAAGNILRANACFKAEVVRSSANFLVDIVGEAAKEEMADVLAACAGTVRLRAIDIVTFAGETQFPVVRSTDWSIGPLGQENYLLSCHFRDDIRDSVIAEVSTMDKQNFKVTSSEFLDFFQKAPIALHWLSGTGHVLWANDTELRSLGYSAEEYIGHPITEFLCEGEEKRLLGVFGQLAAGRTVRNAPFRFRAKSGDVKYLLVDSNVNFNEDGSFRHTRCFIRNDNERIVREAVLETDRRLTAVATAGKDNFIRRVFHEVQTPLHVLSGMLGVPAQSLSEQDLYEVNRTLDVVLGIVTDLNFATSCSAGLVPCLEKQPLHLRSMLADVVAAVATVEGAHSRIRVVIADDVPEGVLAETSLDRVLFNLLTNAVRFSPPTTSVCLTVTHCLHAKSGRSVGRFRGAQGVTFSVSNSTTRALDVAEIDRFFRAYYHCVPSPTALEREGSFKGSLGLDLASSTGIGLGLYVSFQLVQLMGGMLSVLLPPVPAPQGDITFSFTLPLKACAPPPPRDGAAHCGFRATGLSTVRLKDCPAALTCIQDDSDAGPAVAAADPSGPPDPGHVPQKMRILVVDDSPICQKMVQKALMRDFSMDFADNGLEAVEKLTYKPCLFNAVLMDLRMPIMDGIEATAHIRDKLDLKALPIIALTAENGNDIKEAIFAAGATAVMSKPTKTSELVAVLKKHLELEDYKSITRW